MIIELCAIDDPEGSRLGALVSAAYDWGKTPA
jgi:hypothetical protein